MKKPDLNYRKLILECDDIPNNYNYLDKPTSDVALQHDHMRDISSSISPIDTTRKILQLIGRDLPQVHHVMEQRIGPDMIRLHRGRHLDRR